MKKEVLRMERVTYKEQETVLLQNFEMNIMEGEIVGLLPGNNSFGLSDLLNILRYNTPLYYGYVYYMEKKVNSWQDMRRTNNKISIIESKSSLVKGQTVATNIFVLRPEFHQEIIPFRLLREQLQPFLDEIGISIRPETLVEKLSSFERVVVEIIRAVVAGHHLIVLCEISTIVNENRSEDLYRIICYYANKGFSFLYISFHFEEILQICNRALWMSNGKISMMLDGRDMHNEIAKDYSKRYRSHVIQRLRDQKEYEKKDVIAEIKNNRGMYLKGANIQIYRGECLAIQSLDGKVYEELVSILTGAEENRVERIWLNGKSMNPIKTRKIAILQEQPGNSMLFHEMSYMDNLCFTIDHRMSNIWRNKKIKDSIRREYTEMLGEDVFNKSINELTNTQKIDLIFARIILQKPEILICIQPYKGADLSQRIHIWERQKHCLKRGITIVMLVVNMADSLSIADRVIRIGKNMKMQEYSKKNFGSLPLSVPWSDLYNHEKDDSE